MRRIGILGGTFNPIHIGHLMIAQVVSEKFGLDQVIFVPAYLPPHKSARNVIDARHRLKMVQLAVRGNARFKVVPFEIEKGGKSYTIKTVRHFQRKYSKTKFFFIIGSDHIRQLHTWREIKEIVKIVSFIAVYRPGFKAIRSPLRIRSIRISGVHTSSSDIRRRLMTGKSVKHLVPENVLRYMKKHQLYGMTRSSR